MILFVFQLVLLQSVSEFYLPPLMEDTGIMTPLMGFISNIGYVLVSIVGGLLRRTVQQPIFRGIGPGRLKTKPA